MCLALNSLAFALSPIAQTAEQTVFWPVIRRMAKSANLRDACLTSGAARQMVLPSGQLPIVSQVPGSLTVVAADTADVAKNVGGSVILAGVQLLRGGTQTEDKLPCKELLLRVYFQMNGGACL
jgi:hypothetical protein